MTTIPEKHIEFCRKVARLAAKMDLNSVGMTFQPGYSTDDWRDKITMNWETGRHGNLMGEIRISSTVQVFAKVDLSNGGAG